MKLLLLIFFLVVVSCSLLPPVTHERFTFFKENRQHHISLHVPKGYQEEKIRLGQYGKEQYYTYSDGSRFVEKAEEAAGFYRSIGQKSARIISKEVIHISNEYCLVTVHWSVIFEKTGEQPVEFDVSYLVQEIQDEMKIILFISHEDEMEAMKKLGLKPEALT